MENLDAPDYFYGPNEDGTDPSFLQNISGSCSACCYYRPVVSQSWYWSYLSPTPITVGTAVVVIDPKSNRTSTTTIVHTTAVLSGDGSNSTYSGAGLWLSNGTYYGSSLPAPKTAFFRDLEGVNQTIVYPSLTQQITKSQNWIGHFSAVEDGTTTCISNDGQKSQLPSLLTTLAQPTGVADSADPYGVWYKLASRNPVGMLGKDDIVEYFGEQQLVLSVYETCDMPQVVAAATTVAIASFLLDTSTSYGSVAASTSSAAPAAKATPDEPTPTKATADPLTASLSSSLGMAVVKSSVTESTQSPVQADPLIGPTSGSSSRSTPAAQQGGSSTNSLAVDTTPLASPGSSSSTGLPASAVPGPVSSSSVAIGDVIISALGDGASQQAATPSASPTNALEVLTQATQSKPVDVANTPSGAASNVASARASQAQPPPITIGRSTITADSSSQYVVGSQTLVAGGSAITIDSSTYAVATSASAIIVNGQPTPIAQPAPAPSPIVIAGSTVTANSASQYVVGSQTLVAGGTPITIDGTTIAIALSATAIVVDGTTKVFAPGSTTAQIVPLPQITVAGSIVTANSASQFVVGSQTLAAGAPAITVSGTTYSLASSGTAVIVNGKTSPIAAASGVPVTIASDLVATPVGSGAYVLPSSGGTISAGGSPVVIYGTTYSLASSGSAIVVNGVTTPIAQAGAKASETALVVDGVTMPLTAKASQAQITIAGSTVDANPDGGFVIGSQTLKPGGPALTLDGSTYSLATIAATSSGQSSPIGASGSSTRSAAATSSAGVSSSSTSSSGAAPPSSWGWQGLAVILASLVVLAAS